MLIAELFRRNARALLETVRKSTGRRRMVEQFEIDDIVLREARRCFCDGIIDSSLLEEITAEVRERTRQQLQLGAADS